MTDQRTEEWFKERAGKVTASMLSNVLMKPTTAGYQNYKAQLVCERLTGEPTETFTSAAMQHGTDTEPQARAMYQLESGNMVRELGFIPHPIILNTGASPDGAIDAGNGLVEIKCPQQAKHIKNLSGGKIDRNYMLQMQWQMDCTNTEWCDFVSFNPSFPEEMQISIVRIERDNDQLTEIREAVRNFLIEVDETVNQLQEKYQIEKAA